VPELPNQHTDDEQIENGGTDPSSTADVWAEPDFVPLLKTSETNRLRRAPLHRRG
jgi:hypothetical protein